MPNPDAAARVRILAASLPPTQQQAPVEEGSFSYTQSPRQLLPPALQSPLPGEAARRPSTWSPPPPLQSPPPPSGASSSRRPSTSSSPPPPPGLAARRDSYSQYLFSPASSPARLAAPTVRYNVLSLDPHRLLTGAREAGSGAEERFDFDFDCLRRHGQARLKALVAVTAYNEPWSQIQATLHGVLENLCALHELSGGGGGGAEDGAELRGALAGRLAPHEIGVVVVFDGREKMSASMYGAHDAPGGCVLPADLRAEMAAHAAALPPREAASEVRDAHLLELDYCAERARGLPYEARMNLLFLVKERNGGKLNSHVWVFRALCRLLRPRYCVLLDAGTVPARTAVLRLLSDMELNASIGGCAGEICVEREQVGVFAPVIGAQLFEYSAANFLDKAMESVCGFVSVLPGAFSAYRMAAVDGLPLSTYFRLEEDASSLSPAQANAYLAEDRLLGFEIVAKAGCAWTLHYNADAQAFTDVPATIGVLVRQRRRWGNGSLFAQLLALSQWHRLLSATRHGLLRRAAFVLLFLYYAISTALALGVLGNAFFAYALLFRVLQDVFAGIGVIGTAFQVLMWAYQLILATLFVFSLGNRPEESETVWAVCVHILGAFNAIATALLFWLLRDAAQNWVLWTSGAAAFAAIFVCAALHGRLGWVAAGFLPFFWFGPCFLLVVPIFSMCNLHDVSWGTRDAHASAAKAEDAKRMDREFRTFRSRVVILWISANLLFTQLLFLFSGGIGGGTIPGATINGGGGGGGGGSSSGGGGGGSSSSGSGGSKNAFGNTTDVQNTVLYYYVVLLAALCAFLLGMRVAGSIAYALLAFCKRRVVAESCCRVRSENFIVPPAPPPPALPAPPPLRDAASLPVDYYKPEGLRTLSGGSGGGGGGHRSSGLRSRSGGEAGSAPLPHGWSMATDEDGDTCK